MRLGPRLRSWSKIHGGTNVTQGIMAYQIKGERVFDFLYDVIYLLIAIGLTHGGSSTVNIYTHTHNTQNDTKKYIDQHKMFGRVRAVPRLCGFYHGICHATE